MSLFKNNFVVGLTAGLVATILAPVVVPMMKRNARPLAKSLIKGGMIAYEKGREVVASTGEAMEDVMAEIRAEAEEAEAGAEGQAEPAAGKESTAERGGNDQTQGAPAGSA